MNGPDHYREAERLLRDFAHGTTIPVEQQAAAFAAAQVHATLAAAAATIDAAVDDDGLGLHRWLKVTR